jgi:hypothetical protein
MKLYNKTQYPDSLLEDLLVAAGRAVGARTTNVIVIATSAKPGYNHCSGTAYEADYVRRFALDTRRHTKDTHELKKGWVETDGGYFRIVTPYPFIPDWIKKSDIYPRWVEAHQFDGLNLAELIFSVANHEWRHIRQYQDGLFNFKDKTEKAKHHDNRAWERDAIKASSKAKDKPKNKAQDAILNLALWIEENK